MHVGVCNMISLINCDRIDPLNLIELRGIFFLFYCRCGALVVKRNIYVLDICMKDQQKMLYRFIYFVFNCFHTSFLILSLKGMNLKSDHRYTQAYIGHCDQNI